MLATRQLIDKSIHLRTITHRLLYMAAGFGQFVTGYHCVPSGGSNVSSEHFEGGGLARSIYTKQTKTLVGEGRGKILRTYMYMWLKEHDFKLTHLSLFDPETQLVDRHPPVPMQVSVVHSRQVLYRQYVTPSLYLPLFDF